MATHFVSEDAARSSILRYKANGAPYVYRVSLIHPRNKFRDEGMTIGKSKWKGGGFLYLKCFSFSEKSLSLNDCTTRLTTPSDTKSTLLICTSSSDTQRLDCHKSRHATKTSVQRRKYQLFFAPEPKNAKSNALKLPGFRFPSTCLEF